MTDPTMDRIGEAIGLSRGGEPARARGLFAVTEERAKRYHHSLEVRANLADDYRKLGQPDQAHHHLAIARSRVGLLADDAYRNNIRAGIDRLASELRPESPPDAREPRTPPSSARERVAVWS